MRTRSVLFVSAGAVGAALGGAAIAAALDDPVQTVEPVSVAGVAAATTESTLPAGAAQGGTAQNGTAQTSTDQTDGGSAAASVESVVGLEQLVGTLRADEDPDDWTVAGVEVEFGPDGWLSSAPEFEDYDGDGEVEPLLEELRGLEGTEVTLGVRYEADDDGDRDDADAYTIEGLAYRDTDGAAPWQSTSDAPEASIEEIEVAAAAAVGDGAVVTDLDRDTDDGWEAWEAEVRAADGRGYDVYLDLAGTVLDVRHDD